MLARRTFVMFGSLLVGVLTGELTGVTARAWALEPSVEEYRVKGAFLLNFAKFIDWPVQAFKGPDDPLAICVLGQNPFGPGLEQAAKATTIANRGVTVRQVSDGAQAALCHIVFIGQGERKRGKAVMEAVQNASVLTVGESEGFIASGGVIVFKLEGERVRIEISTAAAEKAKLHISSKLLSLAQAAK